LPAPSANAYRLSMPQSRADELKRQAQSHLNKIAPDNLDKIADRIKDIQVASSEELELVIGLIMKKALTEPHYCETYADLVYKLQGVMPEFESPDGGKPVNFKRTLLTVCQTEFDGIIDDALEFTEEERASKDKEELEFLKTQRKKRCLATMKFIGHLFLRNLLKAGIIGQVIESLAMCKEVDRLPEDHKVECICELLNSIGYTLESDSERGAKAIERVCGRLRELKEAKDKAGKFIYPKRLQFQIQDLMDTKKGGWVKKVFKATAKTKEEIKEEAKRDERQQRNDGSEVVVAGQKPAYLAAGAGGKGDDGPWQSVASKSRK